MRNVSIMAVKIDGNEVVVSLAGGSDNVCGSLKFYEKDVTKRNKMADEVRALMEGNVMVDIAFSIVGARWRLIGKNRVIIGGTEPTKLEISQSFNKPPFQPPTMPPWGLGRPWEEDE